MGPIQASTSGVVEGRTGMGCRRIMSMRINVYEEEVQGEVIAVQKHAQNGVVYQGARIILNSPADLQFKANSDDRSAITFWFASKKQRNAFASAVALTINATEEN
jgi:hypothetical protein